MLSFNCPLQILRCARRRGYSTEIYLQLVQLESGTELPGVLLTSLSCTYNLLQLPLTAALLAQLYYTSCLVVLHTRGERKRNRRPYASEDPDQALFRDFSAVFQDL
ncbi:hypothetical protein PLICRDRAFT_466367 [Plicaturopsis crispa FD-325 SS-3]|nr:hypothetical protein PLICRDRAFT_466367 [Plicaturopsis crispa FD-325 SS-3]